MRHENTIERSTPEVATLVREAQNGSQAALEQLARSFLRACYAVALSIVTHAEDAEDVAQDGFVLAMQRLDRCRHPERFPGWLMAIIRNRARDLVRSKKRRKSTKQIDSVNEEPRAAGPDVEERLATRAQLLQALLHLSERQREILLLREVEGWSHGEIAGALKISVGMSRQHLLSARRELSEVLETNQQKGEGA